MSTREIALPDDVEAFVQAQVKSGAFASADDVVAEALRHLAETAGDDGDLSWLKEELQRRLNDTRPAVAAEEVWRRLGEPAK